MTTLRELQPSDRAAWDAHVAASPQSGFMQSWAWSDFKRREGYAVLRLGLFEAGVLVGGALAYHYRSEDSGGLIAVPDGPVLDWTDRQSPARLRLLVDALKGWSEARGAVALRVEPRLERCADALSAWKRAPVDLVPEETLVVSLGSDEDMLARMKPKGRYNARLALRRGVEVTLTEDPGAVHDFHFILDRTGRHHDFLVEPKSFFINLAGAAPPGALRWALARYKGVTLAAALTLRFGDSVTYLYGGHLPLFPEVMASYAMHWEVMRDAAAAGLASYDLYGYAGPDRPSHPYARFSRFKEKLGGTPARRMGSRDLLFYDRLADAAVGLIRSVQ